MFPGIYARHRSQEMQFLPQIHVKHCCVGTTAADNASSQDSVPPSSTAANPTTTVPASAVPETSAAGEALVNVHGSFMGIVCIMGSVVAGFAL
jgi:hypothetical protein